MMSAASENPTALTAELWERCYVAATEEEAGEQAHRQFDDFDGKVIAAHSLTGYVPGTEDFDLEIDFRAGEHVNVQVIDILDLQSWDGDVMYPEWKVRPVDPDQIVTDDRGRSFRIGDVRDMGYTAPGIGTAEGFSHRNPDCLIPPVKNGRGGA